MSVFDKDDATEQQSMEYMHDVDEAMHRRGHPWAFTLTLATLLFFMVFFIWADNAMIDDVTRGMGQVIPAQGVHPIQSEQGGTITEIHVAENQAVEREQLLVTVSNVSAEAGLAELQNRYDDLTLALKRLDAEEKGYDLVFTEDEQARFPDAARSQLRVYLTRKEQYEGQVRILLSSLEGRRNEVSEAKERKESCEQTLANLKQQEAIQRPMVGTGVTELQYLDLKQRMVAQEGELRTVTQMVARAESGVHAAEERLGNMRAERQAGIADEINKSRLELTGIHQQILASSDRVKQTGLRSPVRGTVKRIVVKKDGVAKPAETIMEIIPTDGMLEIEARFSPQDRGFLFVNQAAMVKITAYDFSIYGGLEAVVTKISNDTIEDKKGEPWYEVRFLTKRKSILYRGEELAILPGMTVSVDVLTDKKSVLSHVLGPIRRAMQNAMTEH